MKYTEEIFNILSKGGFISSNSISTQVKRYYDAIEEDLPDYYEYYQGIGLYLEGGDGYYHFTRKEAKVDLERKLEAALKWIDYMELKEKASKLFSDKKKHEEVVAKLISELEKMGFIEKENEVDGTYKVLTAFHYMEELIDCITISEEVQDEIPE